MAWEAGLNCNAELRDAVREALEEWHPGDLALAIANDKYTRMFPFTLSNKTLQRRKRAFDRWVSQLETLPTDILIDECMRRAERTDTADNGGFAIWIDKGGCSKVKPK